MSLFSITLVLFLIMDPFGNIATLLNLLKHVKPKRQLRIIVREMIIALFTMLVFYFLGTLLMDVLNVSTITVHIASGIILFLIAIKILFPSTNSLRVQLQEGLEPGEEPFVVPLAIPLIAGPSLLATIILYNEMESSDLIMLTALIIAWGLSMLILLTGRFWQKALTDNGLIAIERLMGMVLVLIAVQRFLEGIYLFAESCKM